MKFFSQPFTSAKHPDLIAKLARAMGFAVMGFVSAPSLVWAQSAPVAGAPAKPVTSAAEVGSRWTSLSSTQQTVLKPLAAMWETMDAPQQRKWLALTQTYPTLVPSDQEKLKSRMFEWAALSPKDRTTARLNFALTKTVDKAERAANWEAYQALPDEEKRKLAASAPVKPVGAAIAVKPVPPQKLTSVPVTRNTPPSERNSVATPTSLNRYTLLPEPAPAPNSAAPEPEAAKP